MLIVHLRTTNSFAVLCSPLWLMFAFYVFWGHRSLIDPICCNFWMVLSIFLGCFWKILFIFSARYQLDVRTLALQRTREGMILWMLRALGWGLNQSARIFYIRAFSSCYAILKSYNNSETAVYGCNPVLFWVLSVSCCCLAESVFTYYEQHCSILLAEFKMSILRSPVGRQAGSKSGK